MKEVIVITSCTWKIGLAAAYEQRLADAGIDHSFEMIDVATSDFRMSNRIEYWRELATRYNDYKMIVVTDAWDVIFLGSKEDLLSKPQSLLISAEKNCFPGPEYGEEDWSNVITGDTPWKYSNPGMMAANPDYLLKWLDEAEKILPLDISDQGWCNRRLADKLISIPLDTRCNLFYVISYWDGRLENGSLQIKDDRLWNCECDTYPSFFHFAGHGPAEAQRIIPGKDAPRYESQGMIRRYLELGK